MTDPLGQPSPHTPPPQISRATGLLWLTLVVGVLMSIINWRQNMANGRLVFDLVLLVLVFGLFALLIWKIGQGRNWARIVFLLLFGFGSVSSCVLAYGRFHRSPGTGIVSLVDSVVWLYVVWLLFVSPGKKWFRSQQQ
jgi:succinate-acetate transporter protein